MRRKIGLATVAGLLLSLGMTAEALAQGATLTITPQTVVRGNSVTVAGTGYTGSSAAIASGIDIRFDTREAEPLQNTPVTPQGTFSISVPIPASTPVGEHLVIGTEVTTRGRHVFGAPGRAKLRVTASSSAAGAHPGALPGDTPPGVIAAAILGLLALTGGIAFCVRRMRTLARRTQTQASR